MCGIVGYVGQRSAPPLLVESLKRLEYRGYDSAGVALVLDGAIVVTRAQGKLSSLCAKLDREINGHASAARVGIGHTRWATHGRPTEANAHPHKSQDGRVVVVHNGIFENFLELRRELEAAGYQLSSETDTECFPALISHGMSQGQSFDIAFRAAIARVKGIYAIACLHQDDPNRVFVARSGPPLVIGVGNGEHFLASDVAALVPHTRNVIFLEDGDIAELTPDRVRVFDRDGAEIDRPVHEVEWDAQAVELGAHRHYMQKEIFEQPRALAATIEKRLPHDDGPIQLDLPWTDAELAAINRVVILACGTSWHAGLVGKFYLEELTGLPVDVDYASEYRYRANVKTQGALAIAITQSGETADTLAALGEADRRGAKTLAICNVKGSQATRQAHATLLTHAGPEIGVASTKAFTTQLALLLLLALRLGEVRGTLEPASRARLIAELRELPAKLEGLYSIEPAVSELARRWQTADNALYLGRGPLYPIALEGALKLKEISYIHAEGYPAGEMKHGPIALIDRKLPVIALMPDDQHRTRTLSNLQEAAARDGRVLAFVTRGDHGLDAIADAVVELPPVHPLLAPILYSVPMQLFAYHVAVLRGCDVDQPRNLAKSVTVE
jgi:glutamine---fructose-6-phosphate transaminase (isomerizing)